MNKAAQQFGRLEGKATSEDELHAATEKAYAEALASLANMREMLSRYAPITPATAEHLADVRRFARLVKDVEGLL